MGKPDLRCFKQLEYDKVRLAAAEYAVSADARASLSELEPSSDFDEVSLSVAMTDAFHIMLQKNQSPGIFSVSGIPEIAFRAKKGGMLSMSELLTSRAMLRNAQLLASWYSVSGGAAEVDELFYGLYEDSALERDISAAVLSETDMSDDASALLSDIRRRILRAEASVRERLDAVLRSEDTKKLLQDSVITMRGGRFVVPVKSESRAALKGLVHDVSQSGSTYFIEPEAVVEANNLIVELKGDEAREIERILFVFSSRIGEIADRLSECYRVYVIIDSLLAKAKYAVSLNACRPIVNDGGRTVLKKARHPLIGKREVVPIDVSLGIDYDTLIITGPNTGGKTVALKTVGLCTLMAMSGLLIPALEGSEISVFDDVFADIGDEQSIEQSLSTFSGHITNIARILKYAGERSLVLIDELGAGTDPDEGAALAAAVLDRLRALGCKTVATTHYGEIKVYAMETERVENASCEFDIKTLKPTYRLTVGIPGVSNALAIAARLGIDGDIIEAAKNNMDSGNRRFEEALNEIEALRGDIAEREAYAERLGIEAEKILAEARASAAEIEGESQKEYARARHTSTRLIADVDAGARRLLDEIKKLDSQKDSERQKVIARAKEIARKDVQNLIKYTPDMSEEKYKELLPLQKIETGSMVYILSLGQTGEALSAPDRNGNVEVRYGNIKSRVHKDMLRAPPDVTETKKRARASDSMKGAAPKEARTFKNEINLLGMTSDEAILETDRFIDAAVLSRMAVVYLIHGKGTGALRAALQRHLKTLRQVKSFRLGGYGEGDSGVTIVELV